MSEFSVFSTAFLLDRIMIFKRLGFYTSLNACQWFNPRGEFNQRMPWCGPENSRTFQRIHCTLVWLNPRQCGLFRKKMDGLHIFKAIVPFNYLENKPLDNVKHWLIIHLMHFTCRALQMQSSSWSSWNLNPWPQPSLLSLCSSPRLGHCTSPGIIELQDPSVSTLWEELE